MANMCPVHGDMYHLHMCKQYTAGLGLKTRQDLIDFCRKNRDQIGRGKMHGEFLRQFQASKSVRQILRGDEAEMETA
jgi:hypothetical protein